MPQRRAGVLAATLVRIGIVMRQIGVDNHMRGCLHDLGYAGRNREQQRKGNQQPHFAELYRGTGLSQGRPHVPRQIAQL